MYLSKQPVKQHEVPQNCRPELHFRPSGKASAEFRVSLCDTACVEGSLRVRDEREGGRGEDGKHWGLDLQTGRYID